MKPVAALVSVCLGACLAGACESSGEYDGVSRFASTPYYGPGSPPREAPEIPGRTDQDTLGGKLEEPGQGGRG